MPSITKHNIFSSALLCLLWLFLCTSLSYNLQAQAAATIKAQKIVYACKAWGFLKYYHPNMCCNTQWDDSLINALQYLDTAQASDNLTKEIEYLLRAASDTTMLFSLKFPLPIRDTSARSHIKLKNDIDWIHTPLISSSVQQQLRLLSENKQPTDNFYLYTQRDQSQIPTFSNEVGTSEVLPNKYHRLLSLARLWNFIHYFYPYKNLLETPWDSVLTEFIPQFIAVTTKKEYLAAILRLRTHLHDTHTVVNAPSMWSFFGEYYLPIPLEYVEEKVVVETTNTKIGVERGDIVLTINGNPADTLIQYFRKYLGASNDAVQYHTIVSNLLRYSQDDSVDLELLTPKGIKKISVQCPMLGSYRSPSPVPKPLVHILDSTQKLLYIDFTQITPQQIFQTVDTMMHYRGVVFDLRGYPEWILYAIMTQLADPTPFAFIRNPDYRMPGYVSEYYATCGFRRKYLGNIVVLVNEQTISRAEFTAMALQTIPGMKTVGSQTAGTDGDVRKIGLPGGITMMITGVGIYYPNKENTQRVGVRIDVIAKPTIAGIRAGRDEVLEKGVEVLRALIKQNSTPAQSSPRK